MWLVGSSARVKDSTFQREKSKVNSNLSYPIGGGGPFTDADDIGLGALIPPVFLKFEMDGKGVGPDPFC